MNFKYYIQLLMVLTLAMGQFADIPDTTYAMSGSSIGVPIQVEGLENFEGSSMTLTYSGEILTAENVILNTELIGSNYAIVYNVNTTNTVLLTIWAQTNPLFSGSGIIAYIQFAADGEAGDSSIINFTNLWINDTNQLVNSDGGAVFIGLSGCTDEFACNFNVNAYFNDGSCDYLDCNEDCGGNASLDCAGVCDDNPNNDSVYDCASICDDNQENDNICGCTDSAAKNCTENSDLCDTCIYGIPCAGFYNPEATFNDGSCEYISPDWFQYINSTAQAFYFFYDVYTIENQYLDSTDWVGAFRCSEWGQDNITCLEYGTCVGSRIWNLENCGGVCEVPVMGNDGQPYSVDYLNPGEYPAFVIFDNSEHSFYSAIPMDSLNQPYNETWQNFGFIDIPQLKADEFIGLKNNNNLAKAFQLFQNYPNPFNPITFINYDLDELAQIKLSIIDISGREIVVLENGVKRPGSYTISWNAVNNASGIYFLQMQTGSSVLRKKMILLK